MSQKVWLHEPGLVDYREAWDYQEKLFSGTVATKFANRDLPPGEQKPTRHHLIACEHPHVYTLGKSGDENHLLANNEFLKNIGATYYRINRGGDITYHGPGQLVVYPIFDLDRFFTDIHKYLRYLEEAVILTLQHYGIQAGRLEGLTGVWLDPDDPAKARKICAMGVRCSRWVTMHGLALNINTDLEYFNYIVPCGISDRQVTSMHKELGRQIDMEEAKNHLLGHIGKLFDCTFEKIQQPISHV